MVKFFEGFARQIFESNKLLAGLADCCKGYLPNEEDGT